MNIIYFNTHDSGQYFSPYGYKVPTPNIEEFAKDAILFRNAFCASPTCSPSRGALLTGMYPHTNGLIGLSHRGFEIEDYEKHLGALLKKHEYSTAIAGTEHIANIGLGEQHNMNYEVLPYDQVLGPAGVDNDILNAQKVANYINDFEQDKFFISFGLWGTHRDYPEKVVKGYEADRIKPPIFLDDNEITRKDYSHYCASVSNVDKCFSIVIEALKKKGIYEETIIIFTTDHGLPNPYMKCNLTDGGMAVAMIIRVPGARMNGQVINNLCSQVDVFPTLCDLLKIKKPDYLQGISFQKQIEGEQSEARDVIYGEVNYHVSYEPMRCIRTKNYKYIYVIHDYPYIMMANMDDSNLKKVVLSEEKKGIKRNKEYLYNLKLDPTEKNNLIYDESYADVLKIMQKKFLEEVNRLNDQIFLKEHNQPDGILLNPPESMSPKEIYN